MGASRVRSMSKILVGAGLKTAFIILALAGFICYILALAGFIC